jgi:hypothetical protein
VVLQRLRNMPKKLWSQVRRDGRKNFRTLARAQAALGLEILIYMPIRIQNLARLEFDRHLFLQIGPGAVSTLDIPAAEVKNKTSTLPRCRAAIAQEALPTSTRSALR